LNVLTTHIEDATLKMTSDIHRVIALNDDFKQNMVEANAVFKREVQAEFADLSNQQQQSTAMPNPSVTMNLPHVTAPSTHIPGVQVIPPSVSVPNLPQTSSPPVAATTDQVLLLLTDSFTKMASALAEKYNNFGINNLPKEWKMQEWPKFLSLCRDYYISVKPTASDRKSTNPEISFDKEAHQKKIWDWCLNPLKFCKHIENEQHGHPNKCIFHLSKTHQMENCSVKKECDCIVASMQNTSKLNGQATTTTGQLCHITTEHDVEPLKSVIEENIDIDFDMIGNDTNKEALLYFDRISKHYLRLVKSSSEPSSTPRHDRIYLVIADSGANYHMFRDKIFFTTLTPASGNVILGDGTTSVPIQGVGTVMCKVGSNVLTIPNVRYIPGLSESVYSLLQHIKSQDHGLDSTHDTGLYLEFPDFQTKAIIGSDDIYLDMLPLSSLPLEDNQLPPSSSITSGVCHLLSESGTTTSTEVKMNTNILQDLRHHYDTVKTKRQLGMNAPAGFRPRSSLQ
jgi:hypothetical protein